MIANQILAAIYQSATNRSGLGYDSDDAVIWKFGWLRIGRKEQRVRYEISCTDDYSQVIKLSVKVIRNDWGIQTTPDIVIDDSWLDDDYQPAKADAILSAITRHLTNGNLG